MYKCAVNMSLIFVSTYYCTSDQCGLKIPYKQVSLFLKKAHDLYFNEDYRVYSIKHDTILKIPKYCFIIQLFKLN